MNRNTDKDPHRYDDMLDPPHHQSSTRPHMSMADRAAQFTSFAALTGYEDEVTETSRLTDEKAELSDTEKERLDRKLRFLSDHLDERPLCPSHILCQMRKRPAELIRLTQVLSNESMPLNRKSSSMRKIRYQMGGAYVLI